MYLGRFQNGDYLDCYLQCTDGSGSPVMPDDVPVIRFWNGGTLVLRAEMPLVDKSVNIGLFCTRQFLTSAFQVAWHTIDMFYTANGGAVARTVSRTFSMVDGGSVNGVVLGMHWYHRPQADFVVYQVEAGKILRGKNPRVS